MTSTSNASVRPNKSQKIIFLDIDGPMIPSRAYKMPGQTKPFVTKFDQCAVGILNNLCEDSGWKIVLHTSWIHIQGGKWTFNHCKKEGLDQSHFHEDAWCDEDENWRYTRVAKWLNLHPEVTHYLILDDTPYSADYSGSEHPKDLQDHLILVDFDDGIVKSTINKIRGGDWRVNRFDMLEADSPLTVHEYEYLEGNSVYWAVPGAAFNSVYEWCKNNGYGSFGKPTAKGKVAVKAFEKQELQE